ncbi:CDP-alcohol phosphatidyltransferase family protein [Marihabitans asiaticum]|uniref:CDP-alcohol phosphatidyltransferase-like enzyme n=1 Tax=Marihabitans asiaticum TaxID=415218 RepID=A0A560WH02_9MICO|nr:CDP-alcohol phosphatidyltransferase family protein [Marihabitans asiaticum]TWD16952.1 CDP-alcohol phosphatidyltransferase-like enzyme [Marihabitans asiaticum]
MTQPAPRTNHPSIEELRAVAQPPSVVGRRNSEHWAGTLYLRRMSLYFTRMILPTGISANGVTWLMIVVGAIGAAVLMIPTWWAVLACAVLMQVQILIDCSDGEVARWRGTSSPMGVYLDRVGHYVTEAALPIALGVHVDGGLGSVGGWTTLGALTGCLVLLKKSFGDLVFVARLYAGLPKPQESAEVAASRSSGLRSARSALRFFPFFRAFVAIEYSLLTLAAATLDVVLDAAGVTDAGAVLRGWALLSLPLALATAGGFLLMIVTSRRFE